MAFNEIPRSYTPLIVLLEDAADGATTWEGAAAGKIDLKQNTAARLRADLEALAGQAAGPGGVPPAVKGLKQKWNEAQTAKMDSTSALRSAKSNGRVIAAACVNTLKPRLGNAWSNAWQAAGFTGSSIAIPDHPLTLLQQMRGYFEEHPTHAKTEVAEGIDATAAACEAAAQAISTASSAGNAANTASGQAKSAFEAGMKAARRRLSGLRDELTQLLEDEDERWYAFGFDKPSDPETPEVPANLVLTAGPAGSGELSADWDEARRATGYRATVRRASDGVELASQLVADSDADFTGLPAEVPLEVVITARGPGGSESGGSEPAAVTLPGAAPELPGTGSLALGLDGSGGVTATITAPGAETFELERAPEGTSDWTAAGAGAGPDFTDAPGPGTWHYRARGVNPAGAGPWSESATIAL